MEPLFLYVFGRDYAFLNLESILYFSRHARAIVPLGE